MVNDPELRGDVARVRERARDMRRDMRRHSELPNWDIVRDEILEPLSEVQQRVAEELLKRQSEHALVPVDRDPVPRRFQKQVDRYFERLGTGQ